MCVCVCVRVRRREVEGGFLKREKEDMYEKAYLKFDIAPKLEIVLYVSKH